MKAPPGRVLSRAEADAWAHHARQAGQRVVFTNGVFDLVHPGHVRYLHAARSLGELLIVGVNSDRSVRANKGHGRPINPEHVRLNAHEIIARIQPDVLVKGADWGADHIVGRDIVEARGGRVVRIELAPGFSTTKLIEKIRQTG